MPDNTQLGASDPAGAIAATDEISGVHYQRIKTGHGGDGSYTDTSLSDPLPTLSISATTATLVNATAGAEFAALTAGACRAVYVENNRAGAVDLEFRRGGSGGTRVIPAGSWCYIDAITDASQVQLKRLDGAATSVTVSTELRA